MLAYVLTELTGFEILIVGFIVLACAGIMVALGSSHQKMKGQIYMHSDGELSQNPATIPINQTIEVKLVDFGNSQLLLVRHGSGFRGWLMHHGHWRTVKGGANDGLRLAQMTLDSPAEVIIRDTDGKLGFFLPEP